jgi:CheY-like chemotaxis protein
MKRMLDIQMPGINGLDVMRYLRAILPTRPLPLVALTGSALEGEMDRCLEAGASAFLAKPCNLSELMESIGLLLGREAE